MRYSILMEFCTNVEGLPFQKIYYGINDEFIPAYEIESGSNYEDFAITFSQSLNNKSLSLMQFKNLNTGNIYNEKTLSSIYLGTRVCTNEEYKKCAQNIYDTVIKLKEVNLYSAVNGNIITVIGYVPLDNSKEKYTRDDIDRLTK